MCKEENNYITYYYQQHIYIHGNLILVDRLGIDVSVADSCALASTVRGLLSELSLNSQVLLEIKQLSPFNDVVSFRLWNRMEHRYEVQQERQCH